MSYGTGQLVPQNPTGPTLPPNADEWTTLAGWMQFYRVNATIDWNQAYVPGTDIPIPGRCQLLLRVRDLHQNYLSTESVPVPDRNVHPTHLPAARPLLNEIAHRVLPSIFLTYRNL